MDPFKVFKKDEKRKQKDLAGNLENFNRGYGQLCKNYGMFLKPKHIAITKEEALVKLNKANYRGSMMVLDGEFVELVVAVEHIEDQ